MKTKHPALYFGLVFCSVQIMLLYQVYSAISFADEVSIETGEDPDTKLKYWLFDDKGFYLKLTQRLPDQTRAYLEARGFDQSSAEIAATSCFFQTMVKNSGSKPGSIMETELSDWRVVTADTSKAMLLREYWKQQWLERKLPQSARVAFEWSLLPSSIRYDVNDYNWGMSSYGLSPGRHFNLFFSWVRDGKRFNGQIMDIICPDDIHPEPAAE